MNRHYPLDEHSTLNVNLTDEGVIFDLVDADGEVIATAGMMADEWATYLFPAATRFTHTMSSPNGSSD